MNDEGLIITLIPPPSVIRWNEPYVFTAEIENRRSNDVTLVSPGDGSQFHRRTPLIGWSVLLVNDEERRHSQTIPSKAPKMRCGTFPAIRSKDILVLSPGDRMKVYDSRPPFPCPGRYGVVFYYENNPSRLGRNVDPLVREKVLQSHPCSLRSKEVIVEVIE